MAALPATAGMLGLSWEWNSLHPYNFGCTFDFNVIGIFTSFVGEYKSNINTFYYKKLKFWKNITFVI